MIDSQDQFGGLPAAREQFEATQAVAQALTAPLNDAELNWQPAPGSWSIAQCLAHLATSTDSALPAIDRAIAKGRERGWLPEGPVRYGWFSRWMTASMEPPVKRRMKTFAIFQPPRAPLEREQVLALLAASRGRLLERVRQAAGVNLKRAIVVSPVSSLFRMPLGAYLAFLAAHDRRHLWQARQVREAPGFGQPATIGH